MRIRLVLLQGCGSVTVEPLQRRCKSMAAELNRLCSCARANGTWRGMDGIAMMGGILG